MSYKYNVSIILVNYNGKRYIDELFFSLKELEHPDFQFEVVFVDNCSVDGSVEYLKKIEKDMPFKLQIISNKENLGFAGGNNAGVKACEGEYIVLLNNDTKVSPDWLKELYYFIRTRENVIMANSKILFFYDFIKIKFSTTDIVWIDPQIKINGEAYKLDDKFMTSVLKEEGLIGVNSESSISIPLLNGRNKCFLEIDVLSSLRGNNFIELHDKRVELQHGYVEVSIEEEYICKNSFALIQNAGSGVNEGFDGYDIGFCKLDGPEYSKPYEINNGCGAAIIMKRNDFIRCGMFDERFFMYYEDTDLSYRIKKLGGRIMFCPTAVVRHIHTGSSSEWSPFFTYHVYRNKLLFVYKNISKILYFKQFIALFRQGKRENSLYKMCGCKDSLKIILGIKKKTSFRW